MRRPPSRLAVVAGLLALGALVGQGVAGMNGAAAPPAPEQVPIVGATLLCPDIRQVAGAQTTRAAAGLAPVGTVGGTVTSTVVGTDERAELPLTAAGQAVPDLGLQLADGALAVEATGGSAPGLSAVQTTEAASGPERGLGSLPCLAPRTDQWLLGPGATVGDTAVLVLVNPDPVEAAVDVTVLSAEGPVDPRRGRGLRVPAAGRTLVPLEEIAPDRTATAAHVVATRGRVAAALRHSRISGTTSRGFDYVAATSSPAVEQVVPALPAGPGGRAVLVANPRDTDVVVDVELTAADGQFVPSGLAELVVPAGSTVVADLSQALATTPAAARVTSAGGPVLAAGLSEDTGPGDVRDFAYLPAVPALPGPAVVPDVQVDGVTGTVLLLSALGGDAVVDVEVGPVVGGQDVAVPVRRVEVPGGRTVALALNELVPVDLRARVAVVVRPDDVGAPVHASLVRRAAPAGGPLLTTTALRSSPAEVERPRVSRDPGVGLG